MRYNLKAKVEGDSAVDERYRLNLLLDFYGALLNDHAREYLRLRLEEDMSLQEIADFFGVSRQAVHDSVTKSEKQLNEYEEKLGLIARFDRMKSTIQQCEASLGDARKALDKAEALIKSLE